MKVAEVPIEDPCREDLARMPRASNSRYCDRCRRKVHDLSSMTKARAQAFVAAAGDNVCVSYVHDDNGDIVFQSQTQALLLARRDDARRLLTVAAAVPIMVAAACNRGEPRDREAVTIAAASASAAQCDDVLHAKQDEVTAIKSSLIAAKDVQERTDLMVKLNRATDELKQLEGPVEPGRHTVAGKMKMPTDSNRNAGGCKCPPGDPLCSCL